MESLGSFAGVAVVLFVAVLLVLVGREIVCWYWKINETLSVLRQIANELARARAARDAVPQATLSSSRAPPVEFVPVQFP